MVSGYEEEGKYLMGDKRKQKADICQNYKRNIPLVSLLLWHKMVAVHCFVWPLALRLWSDRQADRQAGSQMKDFLKFNISTL